MKTVVITGASSGIGKATAKFYADKGWQVAATMRNPEKEKELITIENIKVYQLDVSNKDSITKATEEILKDYKKIDVLINNAGYALVGPFEGATSEQMQAQFDVNVFGLMNVTKEFLPHFRENKSGVIINLSSLNGLISFPFNSAYNASKFAVEGFSNSLAYELHQFGIKVKLIVPGPVETNFGGSSMVFSNQPEIEIYKERVFKYKENLSKRDTGIVKPESIANVIFNASTDNKDQIRYIATNKVTETLELMNAKGYEGFHQTIREYLY